MKPPIYNRLQELCDHTTRYAFNGQSRLAKDAELSKSTVSRLIRGKRFPSYATAIKVTESLERELGRPLDPREIMSLSPCYPTGTACELTGCTGCWYANPS